ncbi:Bax inhibitor-1/YccA family protein [Trueperella bialowiezensis]|uniref:Predicted membrane protein n=1 Tax=Trueperella bialowiezensis TaxID=312285 RepID=A0A448PDK7_9ACTO|nr:Bax inhibitor-1/YccA family protein [Trueperella bialowiezensis]VEI13000.1 Predicted membrane protein [Trueperella bialowiezensis]
MSNPIISNNPYFKTGQQRPNQAPQQYTGQPYGEQPYGGQPYGGQQYGGQPYGGQPYGGDPYAGQQHGGQQFGGQQFGGQPYGAQAFSAPVERMTYQDALNKIAILLGLTVISGVATAVLLPPTLWTPVAVGATVVAFVVGLILAFQRMVKPGLAIAYAVMEGVALGGITAAFELIFPGIAFQTILATAIIVGVTVALHYSGAVRTSSKGRKIVLAVMLGYLVFSLVNILLMVLGVFDNQAWGARGYEIAGIPLGVVLGAVMILVAAYVLIADFEDINTAIVNGAPKEFAWTTGIAIVMTILWIYVEVLRILAIFASND